MYTCPSSILIVSPGIQIILFKKYFLSLFTFGLKTTTSPLFGFQNEYETLSTIINHLS
ncbi:MAG: hypothetical protein LBF15_01255 [Candidatus Peribacteria bacterium]|nr:hypothetical protein [Candidatus Peribacteria bacterium]